MQTGRGSSCGTVDFGINGLITFSVFQLFFDIGRQRHLAKSLEIKGDRVGILEMRRHLSCYFKGLPDFKETRLKLVTINDPQELFATLDYIAERWGEEAPEIRSIYGL